VLSAPRFHRSGRRSDRQSGRLVPSRPDSVPAEAGPGAGVPGVGACRSRSVPSDPEVGACRSRSVRSGRVFDADRGRYRGTRGTMVFRPPKRLEPPEPVTAPASRSVSPVAAEGGDRGRLLASQAEAGSRSTEVETEPKGPCPGSRRGSDPPKRTPTSPRWSRTRKVRGAPAEADASVPFRAPEFVAPSRGARFQVPGSEALRGSGRLRGLAPLTSPLRHAAVASSTSPVSPMGLCPLRGPLVSAAGPRSPSAEAGGIRWLPFVPKHERFPGQAPRAGRPVRGGSVRCPVASHKVVPQHPFVGCSLQVVAGLLPSGS
jgi:hypothetical protein